MRHALIVGHDEPVGTKLEQRLLETGFSSMAYAWTLDDAWAAIERHRTALIVVLDGGEPRLAAEELYRISEQAGAPVLFATSDAARAAGCLGDGVVMDGPYHLEEMETVVADAGASPAPRVAA